MNYEQEYQDALIAVDNAKERLKVAIEQLKEHGKPCKKGDLVRIELKSGEVVEGIASTFGILRNERVYVTTLIISKTKRIFISEPYKSLTLIF